MEGNDIGFPFNLSHKYIYHNMISFMDYLLISNPEDHTRIFLSDNVIDEVNRYVRQHPEVFKTWMATQALLGKERLGWLWKDK